MTADLRLHIPDFRGEEAITPVRRAPG